MINGPKRVLAVLLLASQLQLTGLPALCGLAARDTEPCDEIMMPAPLGPSLNASSAPASCLMAALCSTSGAGFLGSLVVTRLVSRIDVLADPGLSALHAAEPRAPLSPPPQA